MDPTDDLMATRLARAAARSAAAIVDPTPESRPARQAFSPQDAADMATAVRMHGVADGPALFGWARARGCAGVTAADWDGLTPGQRLGFTLFARVLRLCDGALAGERAHARLAAAQALARGQPPYAAALDLPEEERLDARLPDPLAKVDWSARR